MEVNIKTAKEFLINMVLLTAIVLFTVGVGFFFLVVH